VGTIVVGVDGSAGSRAALRWAAAEAKLRGSTLQAVYVYEHSPSWQMYGYSAEIAAIPVSAMPDDEHSRELAQSMVDHLVGELGDLDIEIEAVAHEDRRPAHALVERSRHAELLVVGSRGPRRLRRARARLREPAVRPARLLPGRGHAPPRRGVTDHRPNGPAAERSGGLAAGVPRLSPAPHGRPDAPVGREPTMDRAGRGAPCRRAPRRRTPRRRPAADTPPRRRDATAPPTAPRASAPTGSDDPDDPVIVAAGVERMFGPDQGLRSLDLSVPAGPSSASSVPPGSGKSTAVRLLLGADAPTEGEVYVFGRRPSEFTREDRRRMGYLPQSSVLYPDLSLRHNLDLAASMYGVPGRSRLLTFGKARRRRTAADHRHPALPRPRRRATDPARGRVRR
jgi:nucleotide-binding universal stress UspA family protein